jgi:putative ABC transport system permease protein
VIANSVALSTMERRREIAVMKAVGVQRTRVLGMLLTENGILGAIGGVVGVGLALLGLLVIISQPGFASSQSAVSIPYGTALGLLALCLMLSLIATLFTAWGTSGEKPLNVLRYE